MKVDHRPELLIGISGRSTDKDGVGIVSFLSARTTLASRSTLYAAIIIWVEYAAISR